MAWQDYLYTGNTDSIRQHYNTLKNMKPFEEYVNDDYLIENPSTSAACAIGPPRQSPVWRIENSKSIIGNYFPSLKARKCICIFEIYWIQKREVFIQILT
jgi:hypothetical protein